MNVFHFASLSLIFSTVLASPETTDSVGQQFGVWFPLPKSEFKGLQNWFWDKMRPVADVDAGCLQSVKEVIKAEEVYSQTTLPRVRMILKICPSIGCDSSDNQEVKRCKYCRVEVEENNEGIDTDRHIQSRKLVIHWFDCSVDAGKNLEFGDSKEQYESVNKLDVSSWSVRDLAKQALAKMHLATDDSVRCTYKMTDLSDVVKAPIQGSVIRFKFKICTDKCGAYATRNQDCRNCTAEVWTQSWINFFSIRKFSCTPYQS